MKDHRCERECKRAWPVSDSVFSYRVEDPKLSERQWKSRARELNVTLKGLLSPSFHLAPNGRVIKPGNVTAPLQSLPNDARKMQPCHPILVQLFSDPLSLSTAREGKKENYQK